MWFRTRKWLPGVALATLSAIVFLASCGGPSSSPSPTSTPRPTVMPTGTPCGASRWGIPAWRAWIGWQVQRFGADCAPALVSQPAASETPAAPMLTASPTGTPVPTIVLVVNDFTVEVNGDCNQVTVNSSGKIVNSGGNSVECVEQVAPTQTSTNTPTVTPTQTSRWVPFTATPICTPTPAPCNCDDPARGG